MLHPETRSVLDVIHGAGEIVESFSFEEANEMNR